MADILDDRLMAAKEQKFRLNKAERMREELLKRRREQERLIVKLEVNLETEQADVDQLMRMSLTNLFHTIFRSKEEQLELERQQALAAALKLQEAKAELASVEADLKQVGEDLANFQAAERDYTQLMKEKEEALRHSPEALVELSRMEADISDQSLLVREIGEAWTAGKRVLSSLETASNSLEKAENWGKWDLWGGGGMVSTHLKHGHVDDAKAFIQNANHLMRNFRDELADLRRSIDISVDIGEVLKMADYWFDGFIADWVVQGRIQSSQDKVLEAIHQVRSVVSRLGAEHKSAESALANLQSERIVWIEKQA
ncbi:hypothetical protein ACX1C1_12480 [Paenibacillus sp. strain BS8-2]